MSLSRYALKRKTDIQVLNDWIADGSRVLDLGCGRGVFLEQLRRKKQCFVVGVDNNPDKIASCVKRGVPVYQGDIMQALDIFPEQFFDWVVCSRTLQEVADPSAILNRSLQVGKRFAVGFVNFGFWLNRLIFLLRGGRVVNSVFPEPWYRSRPINPVSVDTFETYCTESNVEIERRVFLAGDWQTHIEVLPNIRAGYAIFELRAEHR